MVSFNSPTSELESLSKKRKLNNDESELAQEFSENPLRVRNMIGSISNTQLHLHTPLPSEWQRCLDIKSGKIYFYNTRTQKRSSSDPRSDPPEPSSPPAHHMISLDLQLNLPCGSYSSMGNNQVGGDDHQFMNSCNDDNNLNKKNSSTGGGLSRSPSWLTFEGDQEEEMITAVCKKCHMLVMMSKSSPACPNCKFMHSQDQSTTPTLFKRRLSLLC